jgi:alanine dehydrogenase
VSVERLRAATAALPRPLTTMLSSPAHLEKALGFADLILGAVAVHGRRAPLLVDRPMLGLMKPRSIVIDLSIDMGGCFETSRPTSFPHPTYEVDGIVHFCVPNLPGLAGRSSTLALTGAVLPYLQDVADSGLEAALAARADLRRGVYLHGGRCARESLARTLGLTRVALPGEAVASPS